MKYRELLFADVAAGFGYRRCRKNTYRRPVENSLSHFIYTTRFNSGDHFHVRCGIRYNSAELFGYKMFTERGFLTLTNPEKDKWNCNMTFSFGALAGWSPRSSLILSSMSEPEFSDRIERDFENYLTPILARVNSAPEFLEFVYNDAPPFTWDRANSAIRAAQVLFLSRELGRDLDEVHKYLLKFEVNIRAQLPKLNDDPRAYLAMVMAEIGAARRS